MVGGENLTDVLFENLKPKLEKYSRQLKMVENLKSEINRYIDQINIKLAKIINYNSVEYDPFNNEIWIRFFKSENIPTANELVKIQEFLGANNCKIIERRDIHGKSTYIELYYD